MGLEKSGSGRHAGPGDDSSYSNSIVSGPHSFLRVTLQRQPSEIQFRLGPGSRRSPQLATPCIVRSIAGLPRHLLKPPNQRLLRAHQPSAAPLAAPPGAPARPTQHPVTDPASSDATIFRAVKPGAGLLINDSDYLARTLPSERRTCQAGGHGVPDYIVTNEVTAAGFHEMKETRPWHPGFLSGTTTASYFPGQAIPGMHARKGFPARSAPCDAKPPPRTAHSIAPVGWRLAAISARPFDVRGDRN